MRATIYSRWNLILLAVSLAVLNACGGGGGGDAATSTSSTAGTSSTASTTTTTTTTTTTLASASVVLTGVAASGAPLLGASVKVVDATGTPVSLVDASGNLVGSGTTSPTDGAYRLVFATNAPKAPLFVQVVGVDASGYPLALHSLVQTATPPLIANVTPATNAVVAQLLGGDPKTVFINASANASAIAMLGKAASVTSASDQVKAIIKPNLTDAKITDTKKLDFFQDAAFAANKSGLDFALEGLRIQIVKDATGKELLQFSNKFVSTKAAEVVVDLATAKAELSKTTGGSIAKAITSTIKATTSPTAVLTKLGVLDDLGAALNKLISQGAVAADFLASPALAATYTTHNGRTRTDLANKLANYAANNYQLSKMQVIGCADNTDPPYKKCDKVAVSALVTDATGQRVEVLGDVATYATNTTPNWTLVGNGLTSDLTIFPVAYATYGLNGVLATGSTANPGYGVQVILAVGAGDTTSRTVQFPSGYSVQFAYCNLSQLCVKTSTTASPVASGELKDTLPQQLSVGSIGTLDAVVGAKYLVTLAGAATSSPAYLPADVPSDLANAPFPMLDGISSKPLTIADITASAGLTLSWADWAAANPNMRMFLARVLVSSATAYAYSDASLPFAAGSGIKIPAVVIPAGFTPTSYQVWLGAEDSLGRRFFSKFTSSP